MKQITTLAEWHKAHEDFFNLVSDKMAIEKCESMRSEGYATKVDIIDGLTIKIASQRKLILNSCKEILK